MTRKAAQRICAKTGISVWGNPKPGKHLPASHPRLAQLRDFIRLMRDSKQIHERLVANFDQVWSLQYTPARRNLQVRENADPIAKRMSLRTLRHQIEVALDLPLTENLQTNRYGMRGDCNNPDGIQGGKAGCTVVDAWRVPRTLTTLSWLDGTLGRGWVTMRSDSISERDREIANKDSGLNLVVHPKVYT